MNTRLIGLLGVAGVLAALVWLDPLGGDDVIAPVRGGGSEGQAGQRSGASPVAAPVLEEAGPFLDRYNQYAAIRERPLFRTDRRPRAAAPPPTPQPQPQASPQPSGPPDFLVIGAATGPAERASALIQHRGETHRLFIGDQLQGWVLEAVEMDGIELSRGGADRWRLPVGQPEED